MIGCLVVLTDRAWTDACALPSWPRRAGARKACAAAPAGANDPFIDVPAWGTRSRRQGFQLMGRCRHGRDITLVVRQFFGPASGSLVPVREGQLLLPNNIYDLLCGPP